MHSVLRFLPSHVSAYLSIYIHVLLSGSMGRSSEWSDHFTASGLPDVHPRRWALSPSLVLWHWCSDISMFQTLCTGEAFRFLGRLLVNFWICGKTIGPIINNLNEWLEYRLRLGLDWTCCSQGDPPNKTIDTPSRGEVKQHRTRKAGVLFALYFGALILLICNCCNCLTITWQRSIPH